MALVFAGNDLFSNDIRHLVYQGQDQVMDEKISRYGFKGNPLFNCRLESFTKLKRTDGAHKQHYWNICMDFFQTKCVVIFSMIYELSPTQPN